MVDDRYGAFRVCEGTHEEDNEIIERAYNTIKTARNLNFNLAEPLQSSRRCILPYLFEDQSQKRYADYRRLFCWAEPL